MYKKENWIDFENEISNLVQKLDKLINCELEKEMTVYPNEFVAEYFSQFFFEEYHRISNSDGYGIKYTAKRLIDKLEKDLNQLISLLEIYLCHYAMNKEIEIFSPDIKYMEIDHIISFNYTNTYEKLYGMGKNIQYDYVHGKANINNTIETNNMILGIDEYLSDNEKSINTTFVSFKKYYQRIFKGVGSQYKDWIDSIRESKRKYEFDLGKEYPTHIKQFKKKIV